MVLSAVLSGWEQQFWATENWFSEPLSCENHCWWSSPTHNPVIGSHSVLHQVLSNSQLSGVLSMVQKSLWFRILSGSQWFSVVLNGSQWFSIVFHGSQWYSMVSLTSSGACGFLVVLFEIVLHVVLSGQYVSSSASFLTVLIAWF